MIACICPNSSSAEHTVNTLRFFLLYFCFFALFYFFRYADRLKENKNPIAKNENANIQA